MIMFSLIVVFNSSSDFPQKNLRFAISVCLS
jgi:hypothetical protein